MYTNFIFTILWIMPILEWESESLGHKAVKR